MKTKTALKEKITRLLDDLPESSLIEATTFLEYLQYRHMNKTIPAETPYVPVKLGGLWVDVEISDEDLAEVRHEMWSNLDKRSL
jgi:hypothetical protein